MTTEEFNQYLISIGGLYRCWNVKKGLIFDKTFFEIRQGWLDIVKNIIDELIMLGWDKRLYQVKQKYGGLRFYAENIPEGGDSIIAKYEKLSYSICEDCGKNGVIREGSWTYTLCDEHFEGQPPIAK